MDLLAIFKGKHFEWSEEKNKKLKRERDISFVVMYMVSRALMMEKRYFLKLHTQAEKQNVNTYKYI